MVDDKPPTFSDLFSGTDVRSVCVRTGRETAGPSTALRSGRDDNSVAGKCLPKGSNEWLLVVPQNCHFDRSALAGDASSGHFGAEVGDFPSLPSLCGYSKIDLESDLGP